jgi:hypothetical protein
MIKVTEIRRTCFACPSQWEGTADCGSVYVRFRHGHLDVRLSPTFENAPAGDTIFEWDDGGDLGGFMEYDELKRITAGFWIYLKRNPSSCGDLRLTRDVVLVSVRAEGGN